MKLWRKEAPPPVYAPVPAAAWEAPEELPAAPPHKPWVHFLLFLLTLFTMMASGAMRQGVDPLSSLPSLVHLVEGIPFAATLLGILTVHEFGHYFAARRWGVRATLPYFIPFVPYVLGTLGAVIRIRSPIPHKRALLDIGAAGPLAGFVVAVAACLVGLYQSEVIDAAYFFPQTYHGPPLVLGSPLLFSGMAALVRPEALDGSMVLLSPIAFAGWVGLLITAFNLFPSGQLDGGHIIYALFGHHYRRISQITYFALIAMGLYSILAWVWDLPTGWIGWLLLAFILTLFGKGHPAPDDPALPLDPRRRRLGYLCMLVFILCFTPAPYEITF